MKPHVGTPSVLLVEDDFVLRASLAELLMEQGYRVECAAHGLEAYAWLNSTAFKPSVIVMDLMMPYMDGFQFYALKRVHPVVANVPVIVITASGHYATQVAEMGVRQTFYKPVNTTRLLETIEQLATQTAPS